MTPQAKRYILTAVSGVLAYGLALALLVQNMRPKTVPEILVAISFPLFPAMLVYGVLNLKSMTPHKKRFFCQFCLGMTAYVLGMDVVNHIHTPPAPYNYLMILLPVVPLIYVCAIIIRYIAESDEMWRKIYMEAWAFSGIATGFTSFSYLFVRDLGAPEFRAEWALYLMWIYYGIGLFFSRRRYQ
jgi:hypothetical protein